MSKSQGNCVYLENINQYSYYVIRFLFLSSDYNKPINYTDQILNFKFKQLTKLSKIVFNFVISHPDIMQKYNKKSYKWNLYSGTALSWFLVNKNINEQYVLKLFSFNKL